MFRVIKRMPAVKSLLAIFFLLVQTGSALYLPYLTAGIVDQGIAQGNVPFILRQGMFMLLLTLLSLGGALLNMYIAGQIGFEVGRDLRSEIYKKVLSFSKNEYDKFGTSSLITRNTNDVTQVQNIVELGLKFLILSPLYLAGGIFLTWRLNPQLASVFVGVIPFMALAAVVLYRFAAPLYTKIQKSLDRLNLHFREGLTGVRVIRAFVKEEEEYNKYKEANEEFTKTSIKAATIMSVFVPLMTLITNLAAVGIIWVGGIRAGQGRMEVGAIMAAVSYSMQILMGFSMLTNVILALPKGRVSAKRIYEVLDMPLSIEDGSKTSKKQEAGVVFNNVSFQYEGAERKTLNEISFEVFKGETLAVIGGTGDGKTSLVNLMARLYDAQSGEVKISGENIKEISQFDLRRKVSFASQKTALFMGTVRDNMLLGKEDATDGEIWEALKIAQAEEFVKRLPGGLDAKVEKGGGNFSGGQKQRLSIARTILKDADVYIFDDSFSALDFKTDALIRKALKKRLQNAVTVIVAQRISTIIDADKIAVLDKGKLAGLGTHEELKANNTVYQEIIDSQMYKEAVA